ncbi:9262_t:CDS:1, partial [Scutellospora calospora]
NEELLLVVITDSEWSNKSNIVRSLLSCRSISIMYVGAGSTECK